MSSYGVFLLLCAFPFVTFLQIVLDFQVNDINFELERLSCLLLLWLCGKKIWSSHILESLVFESQELELLCANKMELYSQKSKSLRWWLWEAMRKEQPWMRRMIRLPLFLVLRIRREQYWRILQMFCVKKIHIRSAWMQLNFLFVFCPLLICTFQ